MPDPSSSLREGAIQPWASGHTLEYFLRLLEALGRRTGFNLDTPWERSPTGRRRRSCTGPTTRCTSRYRNRYGRERSYYAGFEGVVPWIERRHGDTECDWSPREVRGLHARGAVPGVRRRPAQAGDPGRHHRRAEHRRGLRPVDRRLRRAAQRDGAERPAGDDRRAGAQGDQRAAAVPGRRRARLPVPRPAGGHPGRRRGAAHPAGHPDRLRPGRRALRARRAVDRPAPARQPPADRDAGAAAQPRQHADRRRARRGHHPHRRLGRRHRPGRRRARRRDRAQRHGRGPADQRAVDHRARTCPVAGRSRCRASAARRRPAASSSSSGAREHNLQQPDGGVPARQLVAVTGVSGSGKSTLVNDILYTVLANQINGARTGARPAHAGHAASTSSTRSSASTSRRSGAPRGPTRRRTPASSTTSASCSPRRPRRRSAATSRAGSRSTSRAAAARPAPATARSRSR